MKIQVKWDRYDYPLYLTEDGEWRCIHAIDTSNVEIEPPCCSGMDCGCYGRYGVYCPDCYNDDMQDYEVDNIVESYLDSREDNYDE